MRCAASAGYSFSADEVVNVLDSARARCVPGCLTPAASGKLRRVQAREPASVFWNRRYEALDGLWSRDPNPLLAEFAAGLSPGRAFDLGAGEGATLYGLQSAVGA